jgi:hypothetical protein
MPPIGSQRPSATRLDRLEEVRVILPNVVVELRLALGEVVVGELLHQVQHGVEGAAGLAPRLAQRPQPGDVDVGVAGADHLHVERRAGFGDALRSAPRARRHAGVEGVAKPAATNDKPSRFVARACPAP